MNNPLHTLIKIVPPEFVPITYEMLEDTARLFSQHGTIIEEYEDVYKALLHFARQGVFEVKETDDGRTILIRTIYGR